MSTIPLFLSVATGTPVPGAPAGTIASPVALVPHNITTYAGGGVGLILNFSGSGVGYTSSAATGNVTVQLSNDPNASPNNAASIQATARWNNHDTLVNRTTDQNSSVVYPSRYIRLIGSVASGTVGLFISLMDSSNPAS